jgi:hypothetical protein
MDRSSPDPPFPRRYLAVVIFVGIWVLCGWTARLGTEAYLLLGVPLVMLFQRFIAHRPLAALWVASANRVRLAPKALLVAIVLALTPLMLLAWQWQSAMDWAVRLWLVCASLGAVDAALAYVKRRANICASGLGTAIFISVLWGLWHLPIAPDNQSLAGVVRLLALQVPLGILLSYTWRSSGTLLLPAVAHAWVDAYRNVILG